MTPPRVSCIIAAYNEAPRLGAVLRIAAGHPSLFEVIVVDDGSSDGTLAVARAQAGIQVLSLQRNQGKSRAVLEGLRKAQGDLILLLDADLSGLQTADISALLRPVLEGEAVMALSLKANAYPPEKFFGLEFITGERCFRRSLLGDQETLGRLEGWAIETYINARALAGGGALRVVPWPGVAQARKSQKRGGWIRGIWGDYLAWRQIIRFQGAWGVIKMFRAMLKASRKG